MSDKLYTDEFRVPANQLADWLETETWSVVHDEETGNACIVFSDNTDTDELRTACRMALEELLDDE